MVTQNHFVIPATVLEKFSVTVTAQDCKGVLKCPGDQWTLLITILPFWIFSLPSLASPLYSKGGPSGHFDSCDQFFPHYSYYQYICHALKSRIISRNGTRIISDYHSAKHINHIALMESWKIKLRALARDFLFSKPPFICVLLLTRSALEINSSTSTCFTFVDT